VGIYFPILGPFPTVYTMNLSLKACGTLRPNTETLWEAQTHDEKVQLATIAKEIAMEARKQISEYKQRFNFPTAGIG